MVQHAFEYYFYSITVIIPTQLQFLLAGCESENKEDSLIPEGVSNLSKAKKFPSECPKLIPKVRKTLKKKGYIVTGQQSDYIFDDIFEEDFRDANPQYKSNDIWYPTEILGALIAKKNPQIELKQRWSKFECECLPVRSITIGVKRPVSCIPKITVTQSTPNYLNREDVRNYFLGGHFIEHKGIGIGTVSANFDVSKTQKICDCVCDYYSKDIYTQKDKYYSSYGIKHVIKKILHEYISNGEVICSTLLLGVPFELGSLNVGLNMDLNPAYFPIDEL